MKRREHAGANKGRSASAGSFVQTLITGERLERGCPIALTHHSWMARIIGSQDQWVYSALCVVPECITEWQPATDQQRFCSCTTQMCTLIVPPVLWMQNNAANVLTSGWLTPSLWLGAGVHRQVYCGSFGPIVT